jgi:radical SAM superfamily enzyme
VDQRRIAILERIFIDLGFRATNAQIRARITYYHQVGYYALGIRESRSRRLELMPYYIRALTGSDVGD